MDNKNFQLHESLVWLVDRASRSIRKYFEQELIRNGYNMTGEQFAILLPLWDRDGQRQQQLADALCKDKTTITRLIKSVEALDLVKRRTNKIDKREKLVYLTKSGKKIVIKFMGIAHKVLNKAQKGINSADVDICKNVLRRIHETLSKELM